MLPQATTPSALNSARKNGWTSFFLLPLSLDYGLVPPLIHPPTPSFFFEADFLKIKVLRSGIAAADSWVRHCRAFSTALPALLPELCLILSASLVFLTLSSSF